jgi:hypothetical protein
MQKFPSISLRHRKKGIKMERIPKTGEFYRHFKDKLYQIVAVAKHSETGEAMVVYQALYGDYGVFVRPLSMFISEVDHEKYPKVKQKYRFERVELSKKQTNTELAKDREDSLSEGGNEEEVLEEAGLSPLLLPFVEAQDYGQRLEILNAMKDKIGQQELDILYVALDLPERGGDVKEQLAAIENYLRMQKKFDGNRLR